MSSDSDSEQEIMDLDASDTKSDTSSDESGSEHESDDGNKINPENLVRKKLIEKYEARHGKQLFVRFPARLPEDEAEFQKKTRALSPLIVKAHKPRQKHARFCLVDFTSQSDRDKALKKIRASVKDDAAFKGIVVLIPRTETAGFVDELVNKKLQSIEAKKAKARLKRAAKHAKRNKEFTSMIVVRNLPVNVSMIEMRNLFPNAVDIQLKPQGSKKSNSRIASVTLPSSFDARATIKKKLSLGGTALSMRFDISRAKKNTQTKSNAQNTNKNHALDVKETSPDLC